MSTIVQQGLVSEPARYDHLALDARPGRIPSRTFPKMTPAMLANRVIGGGMSVMHQVGRNLKKEEHSTYNRLLSVLHDYHYVEAFSVYVDI